MRRASRDEDATVIELHPGDESDDESDDFGDFAASSFDNENVGARWAARSGRGAPSGSYPHARTRVRRATCSSPSHRPVSCHEYWRRTSLLTFTSSPPGQRATDSADRAAPDTGAGPSSSTQHQQFVRDANAEAKMGVAVHATLAEASVEAAEEQRRAVRSAVSEALATAAREKEEAVEQVVASARVEAERRAAARVREQL
jgi:hypothetical protein